MFTATVKNEFGGRQWVMDETDKPMLFEEVSAVVVFLEESDLPEAVIQSVEIEAVEVM
jgi:hypothetical protein